MLGAGPDVELRDRSRLSAVRVIVAGRLPKISDGPLLELTQDYHYLKIRSYSATAA